MPHIIPIRDLKDPDAVSQMCNETLEPIYITKNGYDDMVIMSIKAYKEKLALLDVYAKLSAAEEEVREGRTVEARTALKELRAKHGL